MTLSTSKILVPFALCAMGISSVVALSGCSKEAEPAAPSPAAPESYMRDKEFRGALAAQRKERQSLLRSRSEIVSKMKEMIDAKRREMGTDDLSKVKAVLDADPVWQDLRRQCEAANAKVEEHRGKTFKTVRDRIAPKGGAAGAAVPGRKEISK